MALADGRNLFAEGRGAKLAEELITNFTDPIAGIVGGHLLLQAMEGAVADPVRAEQFDLLVVKLRRPGRPEPPGRRGALPAVQQPVDGAPPDRSRRRPCSDIAGS